MTTEIVHDAEKIRHALGEASDEELKDHFEGSVTAELVAWGAQVATPRIDRDAWRILGQAMSVLSSASEEQRDLLGAVSTDTLRLAAHAVSRADDLYAAQKLSHQATRAGASERQATFEASRASLVARRDVLHGIVSAVAAGTEPFHERIALAYRKGEDAASLAASLTALCDLGDALLTSQEPGIVRRRKTTRLRAELVASIRALAAQASQAAAEQSKTNAMPVSQAQVDLFDGYALSLLDEVVGAFERAHRADPTIPRLALYTLRNVLRPARNKKDKEKAPEKKPA